MNSPSPDHVSPVRKRSIVIGGHKTSVSLEDAFWKALREIAAASKRTLSDVVGEVDKARDQGTSPRRCVCACSATIRGWRGNERPG